MNSNFLLSLIIFSVSMCITPGPNNIMLAASGANFGYRRTIPHILGIEFGMLGVFVLCAFGLGAVFSLFPKVQIVMKVLSSAYLFYYAYRIASSRRITEDENGSKTPLSMTQAAVFQLINPKALIIVTSSLATFTIQGESYMSSSLLVITVFAIVCIPAVSFWAGFGSYIRRYLRNDVVFRGFNVFLGTLTALSVLMIVL